MKLFSRTTVYIQFFVVVQDAGLCDIKSTSTTIIYLYLKTLKCWSKIPNGILFYLTPKL